MDIPDESVFDMDEIEKSYSAIYERLYGHHSSDNVVELVNYRVTVQYRGKAASGAVPAIARLSLLKIQGYFDGRKYEIDVYSRNVL